mmetsp:Transcript_5132/g.6631  ORF Transcript_5132/g.6631 Transcript_5132/m.6631 type:complete len:243 (-) Transcript_5132:223-951(-)
MIRILVFGATGFCGNTFVEQAVKNSNLKVSIFCRDKQRAKQIFSSCIPDSSLLDELIDVIEGDIYNDDHVVQAVQQNVNVVINFLSSYTPPHNQTSTLIETILSNSTFNGRLIHFGYPRGAKPNGTTIEHMILKMTEMVSRNKYGPSIRDHKRVKTLLEEYDAKHRDTTPGFEYSIYAGTNMVNRPSKGNDSYFGKSEETVNDAIQNSRVWHCVSTVDAADLILAHIQSSKTLPKLLCLAYK